MNINYTFIRHGESYLNALMNSADMLSNSDIKLLFQKLSDPLLSPSGRYATHKNGIVLQDILKQHSFNSGIIIGCSTLLRSMLTAFFISRKWSKPPEKIIVFPYLREIDESSSDKYSQDSISTTNNNPGYCMRSLKEQKEILNQIGILKFFDFTFVENDESLRKTTGDITQFIQWTKLKFVDSQPIFKSLNFFVITHAGVLKDYAQSSFYNNTGIIVKTSYNILTKSLTIKSFYNLLNDVLKDPRFIYQFNNKRYIQFNIDEFNIMLKNIHHFLDSGRRLSIIPITEVYSNINFFNQKE